MPFIGECRECGVHFSIVRRGGNPKVFCSSKCGYRHYEKSQKAKARRREYRRSHLSLYAAASKKYADKKRPKKWVVECPCGASVLTRSKRRKFCSGKCRSKYTPKSQKAMEQQRIYRSSDDYKAKARAWSKSEPGRASIRKYRNSEKAKDAYSRMSWRHRYGSDVARELDLLLMARRDAIRACPKLRWGVRGMMRQGNDNTRQGEDR